jgi:hypothetical protein
MPSILEELLMARKTTRKLIPQQTDDFMKNVLDKRQIGYKLTANSLYGQCGARTSTFYEKDIAASTTATGRLLLTYAKKIIEETYGNRICDTSKHGKVLAKAEQADSTPIQDELIPMSSSGAQGGNEGASLCAIPSGFDLKRCQNSITVKQIEKRKNSKPPPADADFGEKMK